MVASETELGKPARASDPFVATGEKDVLPYRTRNTRQRGNDAYKSWPDGLSRPCCHGGVR